MLKGDTTAAQEWGKLGGDARARKLPPERRAEIARKAAAKRWLSPKRRAEADAREAARAEIRSDSLSAERWFSSTGNPLYAWAAILMCTKPEVVPMVLPDRCTAYLRKAALGIFFAANAGCSGGPLKTSISQALKLTSGPRGGSNAFKDFVADREAVRMVVKYSEYQDQGMSFAAALTELAGEGKKERSKALRLAKRGKELVRQASRTDANN